jgi:hypothetical protein
MDEDDFFTSLTFEQMTTLERLLPERSCRTLDSLPESFPSAAPYDLTLNLPFVSKANQHVNVIVAGSQDSHLIKVQLFSETNPQSNLNAYLYKNMSMLESSPSNSSLAHTVVSFDEKVLFAFMAPQKAPYILKVVQDAAIEQDECSYYTMRVA